MVVRLSCFHKIEGDGAPMTHTSAHPAPHPDVLREIARLGGVIDEHFEADGERVDTPVGERVIPPAIEALLSVTWPPGQVLVTSEDQYRVTFPQCADGDPLADDRPFFEIAFNESTQYIWFIDLDDEHPDDPWVYVIDHDLSDADDGLASPERMSRMLADLECA